MNWKKKFVGHLPNRFVPHQSALFNRIGEFGNRDPIVVYFVFDEFIIYSSSLSLNYMDKFIKDNLTTQLAFLLRQVEKIDEMFLKKRPIPEKWSIQEHLAHLGRYQEIFLARLTVILDGERPYLKRYKAENDPFFYDWCALTTSEIIQKLSNSRFEIIQLINHLTNKQIQKIGVHPKLGRMNVEDWTKFFLLHEAHHIYAIFGLKQRFYITEN